MCHFRSCHLESLRAVRTEKKYDQMAEKLKVSEEKDRKYCDKNSVRREERHLKQLID